MDVTVLILQIATIVVSVGSLVFTLLSSRRENDKKNYIKVVTEQRLKNKSIVRQHTQYLLACSNSNTLGLLTADTVKKCAESVAAIETVLKQIYPQDNNVLKSANDLVCAIGRQVSDGNNEANVIAARQTLLREFSIYDLADWRFIKMQSNGKHKDSAEFDEIYRQTKDEYNS